MTDEQHLLEKLKRDRASHIILLRMRAHGYSVFNLTDVLLAEQYHPGWSRRIRFRANELMSSCIELCDWLKKLADDVGDEEPMPVSQPESCSPKKEKEE